MSGIPKIGIDFAGWNVNIFDNDTKIDKLLCSKGWIGFSIYFWLCMKAYGTDGYYYRFCYDKKELEDWFGRLDRKSVV